METAAFLNSYMIRYCAEMVGKVGYDPTAVALSRPCSVHLSYSPGVVLPAFTLAQYPLPGFCICLTEHLWDTALSETPNFFDITVTGVSHTILARSSSVGHKIYPTDLLHEEYGEVRPPVG